MNMKEKLIEWVVGSLFLKSRNIKMSEFEKECYRWHGRKLEGHYAHYCPDWDYLPIDDTCVEFQSCTCPKLPIDDIEEVAEIFAVES